MAKMIEPRPPYFNPKRPWERAPLHDRDCMIPCCPRCIMQMRTDRWDYDAHVHAVVEEAKMTEQEKQVEICSTGQKYTPTEVGPLVYVASPYTVGDRSANVRKSIEVATQLGDYGYAAVTPLLNHFQDLLFPRSHNFWLDQDLAVVKRVDVVLRLPGKSAGADIEVKTALDAGIPVVYDVAMLLQKFPPYRSQS
jgi:hypothetical protein